MEFDWKGFINHEVVVMPNSELAAVDFVRQAFNHGVPWESSGVTETLWQKYKERTFYFCSNHGTLGFGEYIHGADYQRNVYNWPDHNDDPVDRDAELSNFFVSILPALLNIQNEMKHYNVKSLAPWIDNDSHIGLSLESCNFTVEKDGTPVLNKKVVLGPPVQIEYGDL